MSEILWIAAWWACGLVGVLCERRATQKKASGCESWIGVLFGPAWLLLGVGALIERSGFRRGWAAGCDYERERRRES